MQLLRITLGRLHAALFPRRSKPRASTRLLAQVHHLVPLNLILHVAQRATRAPSCLKGTLSCCCLCRPYPNASPIQLDPVQLQTVRPVTQVPSCLCRARVLHFLRPDMAAALHTVPSLPCRSGHYRPSLWGWAAGLQQSHVIRWAPPSAAACSMAWSYMYLIRTATCHQVGPSNTTTAACSLAPELLGSAQGRKMPSGEPLHAPLCCTQLAPELNGLKYAS